MTKVTLVASPCVGVCLLNQDDECVACGRTCVEIGEWGVMTDEQKQKVLQRLQDKEPVTGFDPR